MRRPMVALLGSSVLLTASVAVGQTTRPLSLEQALALAERASETVSIARVGVTRAEGQQLQLRSGLLPQLNANLSYVRTLRSQFRDFGSVATPAAIDSPFYSFLSRLPFGQANQYTVGLSFSQTLYSGQLLAQSRAAASASRTAEIDLASSRAQLVLDVAQAYYDATLGDRLVEIADDTLRQAETTLEQTAVAFRVGARPEFDVLRARVARDTERPVLIQQQALREIAYLRLKQLLQLPVDEPIVLTDAIDDSSIAIARTSGVAGPGVKPATERALIETDLRAPVRQAGEAVAASNHLVRAARAERLPAVGLSSQYQRLAYPPGIVPASDQFFTNWTLSVGLQVPVFTGGRILADEQIARANHEEARLTLSQARKLAALDTREALARLQASEATWDASSGTVLQAVRTFEIAEVRFREGVSTQTELADSQLLLEQAQANRATAARDLVLARLRVRLLRDLPFGSSVPAGPSLQTPRLTAPSSPAPQTPPVPPRPSPSQPLNASSQQPGVGFTVPAISAQGIRP